MFLVVFGWNMQKIKTRSLIQDWSNVQCSVVFMFLFSAYKLLGQNKLGNMFFSLLLYHLYKGTRETQNGCLKCFLDSGGPPSLTVSTCRKTPVFDGSKASIGFAPSSKLQQLSTPTKGTSSLVAKPFFCCFCY